MLATIDRVFLVVFARHRRKMGDDRIDTAWHKASFSVSMYLVLPSLLVTMVLVAAMLRLAGTQINAVISKRNWQIAAAIVGVAIGVLLDRRWERYRSSRPELTTVESPEDKWLVRRFRIISAGTLVLVLVAAFYLGFTRN